MKKLTPISPIDIIIPHTESSDFHHLELLYTLRSIEQNLTDYRNVFIVGHLPKGIQNVIHIKTPEYGKTKAHKILHKIILAMNDPRVSDQFMYMSDDHYLLKKFSAPKFPYYYDMGLKDASQMPRQSSLYADMIRYTYEAFPNGKHFNVHAPVVYDKETFKQAIEQVDWRVRGYVIKSLYCNYAGVKGLQMPDCKIRAGSDYRKTIENKPFFSIGIGLNYHRLRGLMEELYPNPSCFEVGKEVYLNKRLKP